MNLSNGAPLLCSSFPYAAHLRLHKMESKTDPPDDVQVTRPSVENKLDLVVAAIERSCVSMENRIISLAVDFNLPCHCHRKLADSVTGTECKVADLQPTLAATHKNLQELKAHVQSLEAQVDDIDCCSCRSNLHVVGLNEAAEGGDIVAYMEDSLRSFTSPEALSPLSIEMVH
ncbi:hypothetical protein NDU88_003407 [Pleurodeles waltl]|uniref:Uncharacterized protein n=1 Tax=Pleurodeles waltl TaxID=8319 RepID=A0AAV7L3V2_PLEWA|nr:hypothetical protein NDU88_003407 [Pleurodeles waltl]